MSIAFAAPGAEVVNADAFCLYQGMDIGTRQSRRPG